MRNRSENPFVSPQAEEPLTPGPSLGGSEPRRLPLGRLLVGVPMAAAAAAVSVPAVYPAGAALEYWAFGYWDFPPSWLEVLALVAANGAAAAVTVAIGAVVVHLAAWRRVETVLCVGGGCLAAAWALWIGWVAAVVVAVDPAFAGAGGPTGKEFWFVLAVPMLAFGLPLAAGLLAFAWRVGRVAARKPATTDG